MSAPQTNIIGDPCCRQAFSQNAVVVNSCFCVPPPASNRGRKRKRSSLNLLRLLMKWSHCRRTFTPGPSVYLKVLSLHGDHIQQWLVEILLTSHIPVVLTPFSSDNAAPAAPAAWLPACRRVPAPPQTQTPPDKALTALQSQYHPGVFLIIEVYWWSVIVYI